MTSTTTLRVVSASSVFSPASTPRVPHRVFRESLHNVDPPWPCHEAVSLGYAGAQWAAAVYRASQGRSVSFPALYMASDLQGSQEAADGLWIRLISQLSLGSYDGSVNLSDAISLLVTGSLVAHLPVMLLNSPVLYWGPWPGLLNDRSKGQGVEWVGPDGPDYTGPTESFENRALVLKGLAYRYGSPAARVADPVFGDAWVALITLGALASRGRASFLSAVVDAT